MSDYIHILGRFHNPEDCPKSARNWKGELECDECHEPLEPHYGYSGGYGLGSSMICMECFKVFDFVEDREGLDEES